MKHKNTRSLLIAAATAAAALTLLGSASSAQAQYMVGDNGRANDANNRIGSGGYNAESNLSQRGAAVTNEQIIHGNTTGLSYFHGNVNSFDPNVINTSTSTRTFDRFNAISGPVNVDNRVTGAPQSTNFVPFYTPSNIATSLDTPNLVTTPGNTGLIPAPRIVDQPSDTRLGVVNGIASQSFLPAPGELDLPGPVDPSGKATIVTASPLFGVKQWNAADANDAYFLSKYSNMHPEGPVDRARLDDASIQKMRAELNNTMLGPDGQPLNKATDAQNNGAANNNLSNSQRMGQPSDAPVNNNLTARPLDSNMTASALTGDIDTNQSVQQRLMIPPSQQSTQLAELERRRSKTKMNDQQAMASFNESVRIQKQSEADAAAKKSKTLGAPGQNAGPGAAPGGFTGTGTVANPPVATGSTPTTPMKSVVKTPLSETPEQPFVITSLAAGIKGQGLAKVMKSAEEQMRQGKFTAALDSYDSAQQVAPNNPFITLGRGFAEMGASYYGKADSDLRRSFLAEPALLDGVYDLKGFLGEDRLQFIQNDLKDIFAKEKSERPAFLLAYISHNLGDDKQASMYLDEAKKRAGSDDAIVNLMRSEWNLASLK